MPRSHITLVVAIVSTVLLALGCARNASPGDAVPAARDEVEERGQTPVAESGMPRLTPEELRRMTETFGQSAYLRYRYGQQLMQEAKWDEAREVLTEAIELDEGLIDAYFDLAWCLRQLNRPREQLQVYEKLLQRGDDLPNEVRSALHTYAGNVCLQLFLKGEQASSSLALQHYREAQKITPDASGPILGEARVLLVLRRWEEAEAKFRQVLDLAEGPVSNALAYEGLANIAWFAQKDRGAADLYLQKARKEDPTGHYAIREFLQSGQR